MLFSTISISAKTNSTAEIIIIDTPMYVLGIFQNPMLPSETTRYR